MHQRVLPAVALTAAALLSACSDSISPFESGRVAEAVASIRLDRSDVSAAVGDSVRLSFTARSRSGATLNTANVRWRVQDPTIAVVEGGLVVPLRAGTTLVFAIANGNSSSARVTAYGRATPTDVDIAPDPITIAVGDTAAAGGELTYSNGKTMKLRASYDWSSLDPAVATVQGGDIVGVSTGETRVVAKVDGLADTVPVTVTAAIAPPAEVAPAPTTDPTTAPTTEPTSPTTITSPSPSGALPELPRVTVDVSMPAVTGRTIRVNAGESLQAAIDAAALGDEIVLQAGATFVSPTVLTRKSGTGWITIRTSGTLPPAGTRVTPAYAAQMAKLVPFHPSETALRTEPGAHHYRLVGLEITGVPGQTWAYTLVALGDGGSAQNSLDQVPHHLVLDRVWVHGTADMDMQRCVGLNSGTTAIVDSYLSDCHGRGKDTQAIAGWNGPGPYKIVNNYLSGAGENLMFGGADPSIQGLTPSDIEIRRNHIHKPLSWRGVWMVKNLFELKHAQRVLFEQNVLENNWVDGQSGFAVQLTPLSDNNSAPWTRVMDITFRHNTIRNSAAGINVSGRNAYGTNAVLPEVPATRIHIFNNVLSEIGVDGQNGRLFQLLNDIRDLRIERNTGLAPHSAILFDSDRGPQSGLVVVNNIMAHGNYGFFSSNGQGSAALAYYAPDAVVTGNVLIGSPGQLYPAGNYFPGTVAEVGFVNPGGGDYTLSASSPYLAAGADVARLNSLLAGVK